MKSIKFLLTIVLMCTITLVAQQKKYVSYTVQRGENMKSIAKDYKISTRDLLKLNPDIGRKPEPNTVIIVPNINYGKSVIEVVETDNRIYVVQPKETLFGISKKFNITIDELKNANPELENGLKIGMHLIIPNSMELNENDVDNFIMHTVVKDDTVYNLTKKFEVSQNDLFDLNPSLSEGLKLGMILKIKPIIISDKIEEEELSEIGLFTENLNFEKTVNVAIMLPYELNKYADSIPENELLRGNSIFNIATDFHMGASMAIDSLKRKGVKINVSYFDTQNSNYKLQTIVDRNDFSHTDVVIGPLFYNKAYWLSKNINVPVIAPLYSKDQDELSSGNLIKSDSNSPHLLEVELLNYMEDNYNGENVIIINDGIEGSQSKLWQAVNKIKTFDSIQNVSVIKSEKGFIDNAKFAEKIKEGSKNWILLISDEIVTTAAAVNNLKVFIEGYDITLFSVEKGRNFDSIENSFLGQLNFVFPTTDFVNMENENVKNFYDDFRSKNYSYPSKYAIRGFDITYDTLVRLASEESIEEGLKGGKSFRISAAFNYNKKLFGSFENNGVYIVQYNKELKPVILK